MAKTNKEVNKKDEFSFIQVARDSMSMSRLHEGREKVETDDIVGKPLTINDFDLATLSDGTMFGVFTFDELKGKYYNGGLVLTKMVTSWVDVFGSLDAAVEAYQNASEKVTVKLTMGKTKGDKSKSLVTVEII